MQKIKVELQGETPLLMNSPKDMVESQDKKDVRRTTKKFDAKLEAERVAYRNKKGELYVPATAIKGCLINAASYKKSGKHALRPLIAAACRINTTEVVVRDLKGKPLRKYDVDSRTVVIQRNRVVKHRPMIPKWKLEFEIIYNENLIEDAEIIRLCLQEGGERVGLLDFRPKNNGEFGIYSVTKFEVQK